MRNASSYFQRVFSKYANPNATALPSLFEGDDAMFRRVLADSRIYGEYGVGASTEYAWQMTGARIVAVDTSAEWVAKTLSGMDPQRVSITHVDVGPIGDWGRPLGYTRRDNFPQYTDLIWSTPDTPNVVLVDGRFRVACFLTAGLHAKPGTQIIFDDYTNRPHYHIVERVLACVETCGRQARFERPPTIDRGLASEMVDKYRDVFD